MEVLKYKKIELNDPVRKFNKPFVFDIEMHSKQELVDGVIFTIMYTVDVQDDTKDQILSETEICPIPKGNIKFSLEADAPCIQNIPVQHLFGLTSLLIVGKYKEQVFIKIGYIVDVSYPGIDNNKLLDIQEKESSTEEENESEEDESDEEDGFIVEDDEKSVEDDDKSDEEGSEEESDGKEGSDSMSVDEQEDIIQENKEQETVQEEQEKKEQDIIQEKKEQETVQEEQEKKEQDIIQETVQEEEEKKEQDIIQENKEQETVHVQVTNKDTSTVQEGVIEYNGYKMEVQNIEMNILIPPTTQEFLISWTDNSEFNTVSDEPVKKFKTEE